MHISSSSNSYSAPAGTARPAPPPRKAEAKEASERVGDPEARDKAATAAAIKTAQAAQPVSAVPRAPLSEHAGKLVDKLV